jgi:hypothetical protein
MSFIYEAVSNMLGRELCASDDCIVIDNSAGAEKVVAPLIDIAIGKLSIHITMSIDIILRYNTSI